MGEPKQLLPLEGRSILAHTLANLRASHVNEIVLVLGFAADAIRQQVDLQAVKAVENKNYEQGMGSSLRTGLSALDPCVDASLMVLADQPFVRPDTIDQIIDQYRRSDAQIVVPTYQGFRGNPILLDRSVFPEVMTLKGDIGCRAIFGDHADGIVKVAVDDIGILLDIDSKQDLANARGIATTKDQPAELLDTIDLHDRTVPEADESIDERDNLILVGTEPVAIALGRLAKILGFRVTVVDPLAQAVDLPDVDEVLNSLELSHLQKTANRYAVIASHGRFDEEAIEQAFALNIGYVALVASRKRAEEVRRRLEGNGHSPEKLATLRAPAGLDIRANTAEEIALSILTEIVSLKRGTSKTNAATER